MNAECNDLTERVLGAVFEVANTLGAGFLEKVYERALLRELQLRGIPAVSQGCKRPGRPRPTRPRSRRNESGTFPRLPPPVNLS